MEEAIGLVARRRASVAGGCIAAALALFTSGAALAQDAPGAQGFGRRDSFVFSVEHVAGFQTLELAIGDDDGDDNSPSLDSVGLHPTYWGNLGVFTISDSGLTFGAVLGVTQLLARDEDALEDSITIVRVEPRIGYAGSTNQSFGYWVRGGPSVFVIESAEVGYTFGFGAEAYAVITPVPHFGVLVGPTFDFLPVGDYDGRDFTYSAFGISAGVMGEFY